MSACNRGRPHGRDAINHYLILTHCRFMFDSAVRSINLSVLRASQRLSGHVVDTSKEPVGPRVQ